MSGITAVKLIVGRQGISNRFLSFLGNIDKKAGEKLVGENQTVSSRAVEHTNTFVSKAREADQQHGVSTRFHSYYTRALSTPMGQKYVASSHSEATSATPSTFSILTSRVAQFYHEGAQTAVDIHEEAKRIAVS